MSSIFRFRSGVVKVVEDVRAYLAAEGVKADVAYGTRERTKQNNQGDGGANRVVFEPCDEKGDAGEIKRTAKPGAYRLLAADGSFTTDASKGVARVRALVEWDRLLTMCVWARDLRDSATESDHLEALERLNELAHRAINQSAAGSANVVWGKTSWTREPTELKNGVELRQQLVLRTVIYDQPEDFVVPGANPLETVPAKAP